MAKRNTKKKLYDGSTSSVNSMDDINNLCDDEEPDDSPGALERTMRYGLDVMCLHCTHYDRSEWDKPAGYFCDIVFV